MCICINFTKNKTKFFYSLFGTITVAIEGQNLKTRMSLTFTTVNFNSNIYFFVIFYFILLYFTKLFISKMFFFSTHNNFLNEKHMMKILIFHRIVQTIIFQLLPYLICYFPTIKSNFMYLMFSLCKFLSTYAMNLNSLHQIN